MGARAQQITLFTVRSKPNQRTTVQGASVGSAAQKIEINRNDGMSDVNISCKERPKRFASCPVILYERALFCLNVDFIVQSSQTARRTDSIRMI